MNKVTKAAWAAREKLVLARIRKEGAYRVNQAGYGVTTIESLNAIQRLVAAGKIKYSKRAFGYVLA